MRFRNVSTDRFVCLVRVTLAVTCALFGSVTAVAPLLAASPSVGSISPAGAQRGTEVEVTFNGARLADAQEILWYSPGIEVKSLEPADNAVKTKLAIAA